jgi:hypothetical protein
MSQANELAKDLARVTDAVDTIQNFMAEYNVATDLVQLMDDILNIIQTEVRIDE